MKYVKPFLVLLNILPEKIYYVENELSIDMNLIEMDTNIINKLRKI